MTVGRQRLTHKIIRNRKLAAWKKLICRIDMDASRAIKRLIELQSYRNKIQAEIDGILADKTTEHI